MFFHHRIRGAASNIEFIDSSFATSSSSVSLPDHVAGDLIFIFYIQNALIATGSAPSGWTSIFSRTENTFYRAVIAYRVAVNSDTTSGSWSNGNFATFVWRGVDINNPIGARNSRFSQESSGNVQIPSLTTNTTNGWISSYAMLYNSSRFTVGGYPGDFLSMRTRFNDSNFRRAWDSDGARSSLATQTFGLGNSFYCLTSTIELLPR